MRERDSVGHSVRAGSWEYLALNCAEKDMLAWGWGQESAGGRADAVRWSLQAAIGQGCSGHVGDTWRFQMTMLLTQDQPAEQ